MDLLFGRVLVRLRADGLEDDTIILIFGPSPDYRRKGAKGMKKEITSS